MSSLNLYNTRTRRQEPFQTRLAGRVGMYCCGPTVYNYAHIGNLRTYVFEDLLSGLRLAGGVDHVMNITDVGHMTSDADEGEDKMAKAAKREHKNAVGDRRILHGGLPEEDCGAQHPSRLTAAGDRARPRNDRAHRAASLATATPTTSVSSIYFDTPSFPRYGRARRQHGRPARRAAREEVNASREAQPRGLRPVEVTNKANSRLMEWDAPGATAFPAGTSSAPP